MIRRLIVGAMLLATPLVGRAQSFAGEWYSKGPIQTGLVIRSDGTWTTVLSKGRWTSPGAGIISMDGNMRGLCNGIGTLSDDGKTLSFGCQAADGTPLGLSYWKYRDEDDAAAKPEPVKPEPVKPEPVKPEPVKPEPVTPERGEEQRRAQEIEQRRAQEIEQRRAREIEQRRAQEIEQRRAQEIEQRRAREIEQRRAQEIEQRRAQEVKPVQAQEVKPSRGGGIEPFQAQEVRPVAPAEEVKLRKPAGPPTCSARAPAGTPAPDARVAGTWAMIVPGVAYTQEYDRGSYIERVQRVGVGAPAGALTITRDGRFTWQKKSGRYTGKLGWCTTTNGQGGWTVRDDRERFFVGYLDGANGGFYLFSTVTGDYVFRGQPVR